jgi:hypothetical protein
VPPERAARPAEVVPLPLPPQREPTPVHVRGVELRAVLERLRRECETQVDEMREAARVTARLAQHTSELRDLCRDTREGVRTRRVKPGGRTLGA